MKVEGAYTFPGSPQQVWELLLDPESLRQCIPGVESLTETSPDHWDAVMKVGVAAIKGTYKGKVAIVDKEAPTSYTLQVVGQRMLPGVARMLMNQFFECLIGKMTSLAA
jgi:carbon monoxide dehydrogenase subunit G